MRSRGFVGALGVVVLVGCNALETTAPPATRLVQAAGGGGAAIEAGVSGSVTGSAIVQFFAPNGLGLRKLTFNAVKHADGRVTGQWNIVVGASILHGDVDCLTILPGGTRARLSGIVTGAKFTSFLPGTAFALEVVDTGEGQNEPGDATTELLAFRNAPPEVGRLFCETGEAPPGVELVEIELGNVQVHAN